MSTDTNPRIYVACLASYNAGKLHGAWIDLDGKDLADVREEIADMLRESPEPLAEEWAIHDTDNFHGIDVGEYPDLDSVIEHAAMLAEHGEAWAAYVRMVGEHYATPEGFQDAYAGTYDSERDYAQEYVDSCGLLQDAPDIVAQYFDYDAFARDLFMSDMYRDAESGAVFHNC